MSMSNGSVAVRYRIKEILIDRLNLEGVTPDMIGDETILWGDELGLDSVDALELMIALEEEYGFRIDSDEVDQADLATVANLERLIEELKLGPLKVVGAAAE
jgi:acyl carrier protein